MSQFRDKLASKMDETQTRHDRTFSARVLKPSSRTNSCEIEFRDFSGKSVSKANVRVKTISKGFIGWFPKEGEHVDVRLLNGVYQIEGPSSSMFSSYRKETNLKADILHNRPIDSINGFIF